MTQKYEARISCVDDVDKVRVAVKQYANGWHVKEADGKTAYIGKFFGERADAKDIDTMARRTADILKAQFIKIGSITIAENGIESPVGIEPEEDDTPMPAVEKLTKRDTKPTAPAKVKMTAKGLNVVVEAEDSKLRRLLRDVAEHILDVLGEE